MTDLMPIADFVDAQVSELFGVDRPVQSPPSNPYANYPGVHTSWSALWGDIFGKASRRAPAPKPAQPQLNTTMAETLLQVQWEIRVILYAITDKQIQAELYTAAAAGALSGDIVRYYLAATAATAAAVRYSQALYNAAVANTGHVARSLQNNLNSQVGAAVSYSQALYNAAVGRIASTAAALQDQIRASQSYTVSYAQDLYNAAVARTVAGDTALQQNLDAQVASVNAHINTVAGTITNQVTNDAATAARFATAAATAAGASAVTSAIAFLAPQIGKIGTEVDQCLAPLCDTVSPNAKSLGNLGKLLTGLLGGVELAALVDLLAEAVHNPQAVVDDIKGTLGATVNDAATGLRDLIGA